LYDFLNTPQTSEPDHSWDIRSAAIDNEKVIDFEQHSLRAIIFVFNSEVFKSGFNTYRTQNKKV